MIKILHYIKEDYSGSAERFCVSTYKEQYPDFEFMAWKPGSSPLRILYDNGGLFIGPHIYSKKRLPGSFFEKSFLVFDNTFETDTVNIDLCCYSDSKENPLFLEFMQNGIMPTLKKKGFENDFKVGLNKRKQSFDDIDVLSSDIIGFEKKSYEIYQDTYLMDMNFDLSKISDVNLHYLIINENSDPNKIFSVVESYGKIDYKDESKHFMIIVSTGNLDLTERMCTLLQYHCAYENKKWDAIFGEKKKINEIITEYIGRKFNNVVSCEKLL